ncbi:holo-ACP synthase [Aciduricibacillus chroicocephali]|uniref:Holo-[acyl-carrier-protein] synthase n=1 Tax=Aciduricibacillus chroicocephali TaxID=3054939 RepID=A0ABY9KZQ9_9BACI|nr:holo-ACP synthase [Bacillaceae bacterium 44XB]
MIKGIGMDLTEISRIERSISKSERLAERVLTAKELQLYREMEPKRRLEFLAGRFAAKEAFAKAAGTGIGKAVGFQDIEILPEDFGAPKIYAAGYERERIFVSITHTEHYAAAQVVIEEPV